VTEGRASAARIWLMAARPRTLPAAVAPVLVGTALAATEGTFHPLVFAAAMIGALFIQVGTNLSNDYSDARRGADAEDRLGPVRVTAGGLVPPRQVLIATYVAFGVAVLAGVYLIAVAGWELLAIGVASILAGVLYTGGPRPYGYEGLGEVFVFLFFGVVAVAGSYFAQVERVEWEAFALAVPVGLLASAILVVNNVRDLETDRRAGKRTPGGAPRALAHAGPLRRDGLRGVPQRAGAVAGRRGLDRAVGDALLARPPARRADRADRAQPDRRAVAQRRARAHRAAAAGVLRAALRRPSGELMKLEVEHRTLALREPLHAAWGTLTERELLIVRLHADDGVVGVGEAAPLEGYDGVPMAAARAALDAYQRVLAERRDAPLEELLEACRAERDLPQALAAVDLALWDLAGKRAGRSVAELISVEAARSIPVNATIAAEDRAGAAAAAAAAVEAQFDCVKVKVGIGDDAGRVAAVRAAIGARAAIRIDANGAWSVDEAIAHLRHLAPAGIELAEEPVHGVEALRAVRAEVEVPLAMDETAAEEGAPESGATHAVCLKIGRCGGISGCSATPPPRAWAARPSTWRRPTTARWGSRAPCTPRPG
jgi:L-alanine-DL-glutamate epimerase-like enolase superfamily enzyme/4-hydroxybenzoate polyprenyltransferase